MQQPKEPLIGIVGFLGAGKTTLLKKLVSQCLEQDWDPYVILNDMENATLDAQQLVDEDRPSWIKPLTGSCICCTGIHELREFVNRIPQRPNGITLIEANGTSDAVSLMGFLGVGIEERFHPPVQISVVDVKHWQRRGEHNDLEASQVQVSSLIILTHDQDVSTERKAAVLESLQQLNPTAPVMTAEDIDIRILSDLPVSTNTPTAFDHTKAHWASASTELPSLPNTNCIHRICDALPSGILRVKGCTIIGDDSGYTYFEKTADTEIHIRSLNGEPITGPMLLTVGPGSDPELLAEVVSNSVSPL